MSPKSKLTSIEKAPLIHKFTVLFVVMSLLPFVVLAYFFLVWRRYGYLDISEGRFVLLIFLVGAGALAGFYGMRRSILEINALARRGSQILNKDSSNAESEGPENEIAQLSRTFREITRSLEDNIRQLEESKHVMQYVLSRLATGLASPRGISSFLDLIVEITANALGGERGVLLVLDEGKKELYIKSSFGVAADSRNVRFAVSGEGPGWVARNRRPLLVQAQIKTDSAAKGIFVPPFLAAPMLYQDRLIGVLAVAGKANGVNFTEDELLIISNLASQTAVALENERLNKSAEETYLETISALAMAVEARDPNSRGHSDRVSQYAVKIARKLNLDAELINDIKDSGELHDVGKIGISDSILKKPGPLTPDEWQVMRRHPIIGEGIVKPLHSLSRLCGIIRHHHEAMDGSGYPDGLKGEEIPLGARILSVADSFDAMTADRTYRKALTIEEARKELVKYTGIRYDKKVVDAMLNIISDEQKGEING
ncbi:MAG: HD domain-containing phosphohydrolase [Candidatus Omnitrophota bacterium]